MYNVPYFKEKDPQTVINFMRQHPFAMVIGCSNFLPVATQIPLLVEEKEDRFFLYGHIMKETDHHKAFITNPNVLCVFTGAHSYVSASWYVDPQTASTWNYMSVHAKGRLQFLNEADLLNILEKTTRLFENIHSPGSFDKLPNKYVENLMKAITAFEIEVTALENVFKLSQNRDESSYRNIIHHLSKGNADEQAIANAMEERLSGTSPK